MKRVFATLLASLCLSAPVAAQEYPAREVRLVVPFAPGGGTDGIARVLADRLQRQLGKPVIVENKAGAGSVIGMQAVATAAPDGYTVVVNGDNVAILDLLFANLKFDVRKDFIPVAFFAYAPIVIAAHPSFGPKNVKEMVDLARKSPGSINLATPGVGTPQDLAGKLIAHRANVTFNEIQYKGGGPALNDVVAGHAQVGAFTASTILQHISTGRLRALGVLGDKRTSLAPDVPTTAESGLPGVDISARYVLLAPAGTPPRVVARIHAAIAEAVKDPETIAAFRKQGYEPMLSGPEETAALLKADHDRWGPILKAANVVPQ
jgi:tripartite-type tricarboxylate transporter receptor subunit TctC